MKIEKWNAKTKKFELTDISEEELNFLENAMSIAEAELAVEIRINELHHKIRANQPINYSYD